MSWFSKVFGRDPAPPVRPEARQQADGSVVTTTSFTLGAGSMRDVDDGAVEALDAALAAHGEVLHAIDPSRMLRFDAGGPPVWSVAVVTVPAARPYWLWVTYGMSGRITDVDYRAGYAHEYSIAVPCDDGEMPVWPAALLRHLCRYVLNTRAELCVGDHMPCGVPLPYLPFQPEHHAMMPSTRLDTVLVGVDPLLPSVETPRGTLEVRRFVGLLPDELQLLQRWSGTSMMDEIARAQPELLTDLDRPSWLEHTDFAQRTAARVEAEGSSLGHLFVDAGWRPRESGVEIRFPGGAEARQLRAVLAARLQHDRPLRVQGSPEWGPILFEPFEGFAVSVDADTLVIQGGLDQPKLQEILAAVQEDSSGTTVHFG